MDWEMVIGLETHVELKTKTKAFCSCPNRFAAEPNTCCCPTCMGLPGALPVFNHQVLRLAAAAGMLLNCTVHAVSLFDRKNYFYPDMPKAYQITQYYQPLCTDGCIQIETSGGKKDIHIENIHMEEDAGKLEHDGQHSLLDMNRCGVPLIEIVTRPDFRSAEEAVAYLQELRLLLTYAEISDCRMDQGSLRCDVNLSVHHPGEPFGTRTEIKNLNSFQSVEKAIRAEYERQVQVLEAGGTVVQETLRFIQKTGEVAGMRRKEGIADYMYFPEPDLPPVLLPEAEKEEIRNSLPVPPAQRRAILVDTCGLTREQAASITQEKWLADYFMNCAAESRSPQESAKLLTGECFAQMALRDSAKTGEKRPNQLPITPARLAQVSNLLHGGRINATTAKKLIAELFDSDFDPEEYAARNDLFLQDNSEELEAAVQKVLAENSGLVQAYKNGKKNVSKALMGKAMGLMRGKARADLLEKILMQELDKE